MMPQTADLLRLPVLAFAALSACANTQSAGTSPIVDAQSAEEAELAMNARWRIVIHSGAGIPGTAGADDYYRKPKQVLQVIVDQCRLGKTIYTQATDGVSVLSIVNDALSEEQIACIRSAEDNGLYLSDRGPSQ